jgi:hypothetical protein
MSTPAELYVSGIKKKFANYFAAWLPGEKLRLGDVGVIENNLFTRITSLENIGINFTERADNASTPIDYISESGVSIFFKTAGEVNPSLPNIPEAKAGIGVEFSQKGAFIFQAAESYQPSIENIFQLEQDIISAYENGRWRSEWVVITRLVQTPIASIIVSNSSQSKVEFSVEGDIPLSSFDLGNASLNFGLKSQTGDVIKFIGGENLTPLFQLARIKNRWLGLGDLYLEVKSIGMIDNSMAAITPERVKNDPDIAKSLYLDLVHDQKV